MSNAASQVSLRLRRNDIIDQVIHESRRMHTKALDEARKAAEKAAAVYVEAVAKAAREAAAPIVTAMKKAGAVIEGELSCDYHFRFTHGRDSEERSTYSPVDRTLKVRLRDADRYDANVSLKLILKVSRELEKLRDAAMAAADAYQELNAKPTSLSSMYADERRRIIRAAIDELPEGKQLLECVRRLQQKAEANLAKEEKAKQLEAPK